MQNIMMTIHSIFFLRPTKERLQSFIIYNKISILKTINKRIEFVNISLYNIIKNNMLLVQQGLRPAELKSPYVGNVILISKFIAF